MDNCLEGTRDRSSWRLGCPLCAENSLNVGVESGKVEWGKKRRGGLRVQGLGVTCVSCIFEEFDNLKLNLLNMPV